MRLKVLDPDGVERIVEASSILLDDGSVFGGSAGVANVHLSSSDLGKDPIFENIHTSTAVGSSVSQSGLEKCTFFEFQVVGVDADDDVSIGATIDGITFVAIPVVNVMTGVHIAAGTNIETDGIYRYGNEATATSLFDAVAPLGVSGIEVTRETAVTGGIVTVGMRAS